MGISKLNSIIKSTQNKKILVVAQQKGSEDKECKERVLSAYKIVEALEKNGLKEVLLMVVGGANKGVSPEKIISWIPKKYRGSILIENSAGNTHEKSVIIASVVNEKKIDIIFQTTSLYHTLRAYLTTLAKLRSNKLKHVKLYNVVSDTSSVDNIIFAVLQQLSLAKNTYDRLKYSPDVHSSYDKLKKDLKPRNDKGLKRHFENVKSEADRLILYSENGKDHLTTEIDYLDLIDTYIVMK